MESLPIGDNVETQLQVPAEEFANTAEMKAMLAIEDAGLAEAATASVEKENQEARFPKIHGVMF